jgi:nucleoid-associated protein YgaU
MYDDDRQRCRARSGGRRMVCGLLLAATACGWATAMTGCSTNGEYRSRAAAPRPLQPGDPSNPSDPNRAAEAIANETPPLAPALSLPPAPELSSTQPTSTQPSAAAEPRTHVVVRGDTLYSIAEQYYGTGRYWEAIRDANPGITPERLPIGQRLVVP